jgi:hypothetical protein
MIASSRLNQRACGAAGETRRFAAWRSAFSTAAHRVACATRPFDRLDGSVQALQLLGASGSNGKP